MLDFTTQPDLLKNPYYHKIKQVINSVVRIGGTNGLAGNCIASADIVQVLLSKIGIESRIIECQCSVVRHMGSDKSYHFIGYDNYSYPGQIDTHTVVVTQTDRPILIDLSLGNILGAEHPYVIEFTNGTIEGIIAEYKLGSCDITYSEKKNIRLAHIHQKNLLQRIVNDQKIDATIGDFRKFLIGVSILGVVNFIVGFTIFLMKLLYHT